MLARPRCMFTASVRCSLLVVIVVGSNYSVGSFVVLRFAAALPALRAVFRFVPPIRVLIFMSRSCALMRRRVSRVRFHAARLRLSFTLRSWLAMEYLMPRGTDCLLVEFLD